jgi:hypothetical protein
MLSDLFLPNLLQRMPLVDFLDGVGEIEGWIHQQVLLDADRSLLGIDHAQMSAFKGAQACPEEVDSQNLDVTRDRRTMDSACRRRWSNTRESPGEIGLMVAPVTHPGILGTSPRRTPKAT